ncbi:MAG: HD domain-containing protein [Coriobacteriia bacterium]|nr:HD domain-containing protein [Coriobacteriia bacterium]
MTNRPSKRRLHNEIVYPLLGALMVVGVLAVVLGVTVVGSISERWVDDQADSNAAEATSFFTQRVLNLGRVATVAANDEALETAVSQRETRRILGRLAALSGTLAADEIIVLDDQGRAVAAVGEAGVKSGEKPLPDAVVRYARMNVSFATFVELGGEQYVCYLRPVRTGRFSAATLVTAERVDDEVLTGLRLARGGAVAIVDRRGRSLAVRAATTSDEDDELVSALRTGIQELPEEGRSWSIVQPRARYRAVVRAIELADDPLRARLWVVGIAPTTLVDSMRASTTLLIVLWTAVAVASLFGLGWYLARRVGAPIGELSEAVERVASGDYAVHFTVQGENEVAALSDNLAKMTESLRERTEGLTRKVLELATLYEMSRVLGSTLDLDVLLDAVLDSTLRIFGADIGYVALVDKETQELTVRAWRGVRDARASLLARGGSMAEWVVREGRPLLFNPPAGPDDQRHEPTTGAAAAACVPLHSADGVIGALAVGTTDADARFTSEDIRLLSTIANHATIAVGNIDLYASLQDAYLSTVRALAAAIDAKDPYTRGHSERVATYALAIAERVGLSTEQKDALEMASYLHDIGKIGISEDILLKPGRLSDEEMGQMRHHPLIGANILKPVSFPWPILPVVRHHHEHFDGNGYPAGLRGEEIPLLARILTVADSYEAMTSDRPYRRGRSVHEAIAELRRCAGTQFDPRLVDAFIGVLESAAEEELQVDEGGGFPSEAVPEQEQAALSAVCDGVIAAFRRLGGPRLAANVEREANARLTECGLPYALRSGHLVAAVDGEGNAGADLQQALSVVLGAVKDATGTGLASQFVSEAVQQLPPRMRATAESIALDAIGQSSA